MWQNDYCNTDLNVGYDCQIDTSRIYSYYTGTTLLTADDVHAFRDVVADNQVVSNGYVIGESLYALTSIFTNGYIETIGDINTDGDVNALGLLTTESGLRLPYDDPDYTTDQILTIRNNQTPHRTAVDGMQYTDLYLNLDTSGIIETGRKFSLEFEILDYTTGYFALQAYLVPLYPEAVPAY